MSVWDRDRDPLHGIGEATLAAAVRGAKTIDLEWGDWSNPKAHGKFVDSLATDLGKTVLEATALAVATALDKFR